MARRSRPRRTKRGGRGTFPNRSTVEGAALDALARIEENGALARDALADAFVGAPDLDDAQRAEVAAGVYAVLRRVRLIDHVLGPAAGQSRARWIAGSAIAGTLGLEAAARAAPGIAWEEVTAAARALLEETPSAERLGLRWSLSDELARRLVADLGLDEADRLGRALDAAAPVTARANRLKTTREELAERLRTESGIETEATRLAPDGLVLLGAARPFRTGAFGAGLFELQDEASQIVSEVVAPPPRGTVVDACAGAGGKTLHLGALLANRGRIVAVDLPTPGGRRLNELRRRARRAGLDNLEALEAPAEGEEPPALARLVGRADRVLVDAPCSGVGVMRRKPESRLRLDAERLDRLPAVQRSILDRFAKLVAPGGRLIYATCTMLTAENEGVVERFCAEHPDFERVPLKSYMGRERAEAIGDGEVMRLLPHVHGTDGFFAAVLRRNKG